MRRVPPIGAALVTALAMAPVAAVPGPAKASMAATAKMPVISDGGELERFWQGPGVTIVHFWASWCETCKAELPRLSKAFEHAEDRGARILLVSLDDASHADGALRLLRRHQVPGARLRLDVGDPREITSRIDPAWDAAIPATFVFKDGVRSASMRGVLGSPAAFDEALGR
jgi:thiol-disulfide isomerase/thioredoxin